MLASTNPFASDDDLISSLEAEDRFIHAVARKFLNGRIARELLTNEQPQLRLQSLLALYETGDPLSAVQLRQLLRDEEEDIRRITLMYIARYSRKDLYTDMNEALFTGNITPTIFETFLATIRHVQPDFINAYQNRTETVFKNLPRELPADFIISLIRNKELNPLIRGMALRYLKDPAAHLNDLVALAETRNEPLIAALLQVFRQVQDPNAANAIKDIAMDATLPASLRGEAIISLGYQGTRFCEDIGSLLNDPDLVLLRAAGRYVCGCDDRKKWAATLEENSATQGIRDIWQLCNGGIHEMDRPQDDEAWLASIQGDGNVEQGKLIFQALGTQCQRCHQVNGWGGAFGPDLSNIGSSKSREQLLTAILQPSAEISPEWQGWFVTDQEGNTHYGRQIDVHLKNVEIMLPDGSFETFNEPQSYGLAPASLMPEGLENMLTPSELNDLITYLLSLT